MYRKLFTLVSIFILAATTYLLSSSGGKTGRTQSGCTCHGSLSAGNATISLTSNPDIFSGSGYSPGNSYTLSLTVTGGPSGTKGGFNLKPSAGTLSNAGLNAKIVGTEATQSNADSRSWTIDWTAPDASVESVTFYYAGNAVNGNFSTSGDDPTPTETKTANLQTTSVRNQDSPVIGDFHVYQNYPNPFNSETKIQYQISKAGEVKLKIFDISGKKIFQVIQNNSHAGNFYFTWNGKTNRGMAAVSGTYIYQVGFDRNIISNKLILLK
ncbi:T9SS type A sorting domain-containing protein [candidate division KSB1 bacterium]|nr:T9SS type A sorting domain-containing protein [candidate division KSB1 bacterium]